MALCPLWFCLLNSLIVGLMEEEIRFSVLFNTAVPLAPALAAGQWAVWLEAGRCRVTRRTMGWVPESALSHCFTLRATHSFFFSFPPKCPASQWQLCAEEGEYTHLQTHTNTQDQGSQWGLGELGKEKQHRELHRCVKRLTLCLNYR